MKKKELSRMRRTELISLVRAQKRENERLKKRLDRKSSYDNRDGSLRKSDTADRYIRIARNTAMVLITAAAAAVLIATLLLPVFRIYGSSMTPTLEEGNIVISVRGGEYRQGDIISFYYNNKILVKRVIALPGDWVDIDDAGNVYVNDELLDEPYVQDKALGECDIELPYQVPEGAKSFEALNYYTNEMIRVPLDPELTPQENAKKYFDRYGKLKRTCEALTELTGETRQEMEHLDSIATALDIAETEADLAQIREEMAESGYIKHKYSSRKKQQSKSRPYHYRTADGIDIYVGKNNYQNDELTFKFAEGNDWWFHAKKMPGSHVIVKTKTGEIPDRTFEEAGRLAAYYSKGRGSEKVEVDYLQKKNVKKPNQSKPGFVVYYTNYSLTIEPDISGIELVEE